MDKINPLAFLSPTGPLAGRYGETIRRWMDQVEHVHLEQMGLRADMSVGDHRYAPRPPGAVGEGFVGLYSGRGTYLVVGAVNLGLNDAGEHQGYWILKVRETPSLGQALQDAGAIALDFKRYRLQDWVGYTDQIWDALSKAAVAAQKREQDRVKASVDAP